MILNCEQIELRFSAIERMFHKNNYYLTKERLEGFDLPKLFPNKYPYRIIFTILGRILMSYFFLGIYSISLIYALGSFSGDQYFYEKFSWIFSTVLILIFAPLIINYIFFDYLNQPSYSWKAIVTIISIAVIVVILGNYLFRPNDPTLLPYAALGVFIYIFCHAKSLKEECVNSDFYSKLEDFLIENKKYQNAIYAPELKKFIDEALEKGIITSKTFSLLKKSKFPDLIKDLEKYFLKKFKKTETQKTRRDYVKA